MAKLLAYCSVVGSYLTGKPSENVKRSLSKVMFQVEAMAAIDAAVIGHARNDVSE